MRIKGIASMRHHTEIVEEDMRHGTHRGIMNMRQHAEFNEKNMRHHTH